MYLFNYKLSTKFETRWRCVEDVCNIYYILYKIIW